VLAKTSLMISACRMPLFFADISFKTLSTPQQ
jgi:hypothetical protein